MGAHSLEGRALAEHSRHVGVMDQNPVSRVNNKKVKERAGGREREGEKERHGDPSSDATKVL